MQSRLPTPHRRPLRPYSYNLPKSSVRPETKALTPRQLYMSFPHVTEDEFETYSMAHQKMLGCAERYDRCPQSRDAFWRHEQTLREVVQMLDPPPPYEP